MYLQMTREDADIDQPEKTGSIRRTIKARLIDPVLQLLMQGITPEKLAISMALGAVIGVIPLLGTTTILCTITAIVLRLNLPAIQAANWSVYGLQLLLLLPLMRAGDMLFGVEPLTFSPPELIEMFRTDFWGSVQDLWRTTLHALTIWGLASIPAVLVLYSILKPLFRHILARRQAEPGAGS